MNKDAFCGDLMGISLTLVDVWDLVLTVVLVVTVGASSIMALTGVMGC